MQLSEIFGADCERGKDQNFTFFSANGIFYQGIHVQFQQTEYNALLKQ